MTSLDAPLRAVSANVIRRFGKAIVLRSIEPGDYDTATGTKPVRNVDRVVRGVQTKHKSAPGSRVGSSGRRGAEMQFIIAAAGLVDWPSTRDPLPSDRVIIGFRNLGTEARPVLAEGVGTQLVVVDFDPIYSGDEIAMFALHVKR